VLHRFSERDNETVARLCPYCAEVFAGKEGVRIHLGQVDGRKNHPRNANARHEPEDFPRVSVDEEHNVVAVLNDPLAEEGEELSSNQCVPVTRVYRYVASLLADDSYKQAEQARRYFLDVGPTGDSG